MMKGLGELGATLTGVSQALVTAMQQIRIHRAMSLHWGYATLAHRLNDVLASRAEKLDACLLAQLAAEATPDLQSLGRLNVGQTVEEILQSERRMAIGVRDLALVVLRELPSTEPLARRTLDDLIHLETINVAAFDQHLELVRQMGIQNYLATRC
jgi:bacterioferritin